MPERIGSIKYQLFRIETFMRTNDINLNSFSGKKINLKTIKGKNVGMYYTKSSSNKEEFPFFTRGILAIDNVGFSFLMRHKSKTQREYLLALKSLNSIAFKKMFSEKVLSVNEGFYGIDNPLDAPFKLRVKLRGYYSRSCVQPKKNTSQECYMFANSRLDEELPMLTLRIRALGTCNSLKECSLKIKKELMTIKDLKEEMAGKYTLYNYSINLGIASEENIRSEYFEDGYCLDIHMALIGENSAKKETREKLQAYFKQVELIH